MKFVPKELKETGDISRSRLSYKQIWKSCGALVLALAIAYLVLGWIAEAVAVRLPPRVESSLAFLAAPFRSDAPGYETEKALAQSIVDRFVAHESLPALDYEVFIEDEPQPNAMALPGGSIVLTTGLFELVDSEEALAMVLGHELGHFKQRDHLRGLGRGILLAVMMSVVFHTNEAGTLVSKAVDVAEKRYSRKQESGADAIGLDLLVSTYGHAGGATSFFEKIGNLHPESKFIRYLSSHPVSADRVEAIESMIETEAYAVREVTPLESGQRKRDSSNPVSALSQLSPK